MQGNLLELDGLKVERRGSNQETDGNITENREVDKNPRENEAPRFRPVRGGSVRRDVVQIRQDRRTRDEKHLASKARLRELAHPCFGGNAPEEAERVV